jgi:hypothetical protein
VGASPSEIRSLLVVGRALAENSKNPGTPRAASEVSPATTVKPARTLSGPSSFTNRTMAPCPCASRIVARMHASSSGSRLRTVIPLPRKLRSVFPGPVYLPSKTMTVSPLWARSIARWIVRRGLARDPSPSESLPVVATYETTCAMALGGRDDTPMRRTGMTRNTCLTSISSSVVTPEPANSRQLLQGSQSRERIRDESSPILLACRDGPAKRLPHPTPSWCR